MCDQPAIVEPYAFCRNRNGSSGRATAQAFLQELASTEAKKAYVAIGFEVE
jgi:hypothetical protein